MKHFYPFSLAQGSSLLLLKHYCYYYCFHSAIFFLSIITFFLCLHSIYLSSSVCCFLYASFPYFLCFMKQLLTSSVKLLVCYLNISFHSCPYWDFLDVSYCLLVQWHPLPVLNIFLFLFSFLNGLILVSRESNALRSHSYS